MNNTRHLGPDRTTQELVAMYRRARQSGTTVQNHLRFADYLALWERARRTGRNPEALFNWLLRHPDAWAATTIEDQMRARQRIHDDGIAGQAAPTTARHRLRPQLRQERPEKDSRRRLVIGQRVFRQSPEALFMGDSLALDHDRRMRQQRRAEAWSRWSSLIILVSATVWFFFGPK